MKAPQAFISLCDNEQHPILFNGEGIRALLEGRITQTRRVVRSQPAPGQGMVNAAYCGHPDKWLRDGTCGRFDKATEWRCPYGRVGDHLWVRETWSQPTSLDPGPTFYLADYPGCVPAHYENVPPATNIRWRASIHMPRTASRIILEVTRVRAERLRDASDDDAIAEGLHCIEIGSGYPNCYSAAPATWAQVVEQQADAYEDPRLAFRDLWQSAIGAHGWKANPWVWVVTFRLVEVRRACA